VALQISESVLCGALVKDQQRTDEICFILFTVKAEACPSVSQKLGFEFV